MSANQEPWNQELRQFRLLSRDSVRRLLNTALFSPDADPDRFAIWGLALLTIPPFLFAVRQMMIFPFFYRASAAVVERVTMSGRLFFLTYGMISAALLAALTWEALFPTRTDQETLGTLPIRPRTLAGARFGAAAMVVGVLIAAIAVPSGVIYSIGTAGNPLVGALPRVFAAHVVALTFGSAFSFFTLMSVRGLVAVCAGERSAERLATILQIATIVGLVETFLFLPSVLSTLVEDLVRGGTEYAWLPPVWFGALYAVVAEGGRPHLVTLAQVSVLATLASIGLAAAVSLVPAKMMGRRALETRAIEGGQGFVVAARAFAALFIRKTGIRAIFLFAIASLASSRRHRLMLSMYLGLAIAAATMSLATGAIRGSFSVAEPTRSLIAVPLVFMFLLIFGLRSCLTVPTLLAANWPFRLAPPTVPTTLSAARLVIVFAALIPIVAVTALIAASLWSTDMVLRLVALDAVAGACLLEGALLRWASIPFASDHEPSTETVKSRWLLHAFGLGFFAVGGSSLQHAALGNPGAWMAYVVSGLSLLAVLRLATWYLSRHRDLVVDIPWAGPELLNLSDGLD
jgi:hypothetical protein